MLKTERERALWAQALVDAGATLSIVDQQGAMEHAPLRALFQRVDPEAVLQRANLELLERDVNISNFNSRKEKKLF